MRKLPIYLLLTMLIPLASLLLLGTASAADCESTACIDVYTQDGQIIIEGKKGSGPKAKSIPKPRVVKPPTPKVIPPKAIFPLI
jgi:hypothetical protein